MTRVAKQCHPANRPFLKRRAIEKPPNEGFFNCVYDGPQLWIPISKAIPQVIHVAAVRPGFTGPRRPFDIGDEVHQPLSGHVVDDDVLPRPKPNLRGHLKIKMLDALGWN